jgi:hypothetical protein
MYSNIAYKDHLELKTTAIIRLLFVNVHFERFALFIPSPRDDLIEIDEKGTLKATEHNKYENISGSV